MLEFFTSSLIFIVFLNYLSLSLFVFRELSIDYIILITTIFYLYILLATIIIIEVIGPITNLI